MGGTAEMSAVLFFFVNEPEPYVTSVPASGAMSLFGIPDPPASLLRRFPVRVEHEDGTPLPSVFLSGVQTDGAVYRRRDP